MNELSDQLLFVILTCHIFQVGHLIEGCVTKAVSEVKKTSPEVASALAWMLHWDRVQKVLMSMEVLENHEKEYIDQINHKLLPHITCSNIDWYLQNMKKIKRNMHQSIQACLEWRIFRWQQHQQLVQTLKGLKAIELNKSTRPVKRCEDTSLACDALLPVTICCEIDITGCEGSWVVQRNITQWTLQTGGSHPSWYSVYPGSVTSPQAQNCFSSVY